MMAAISTNNDEYHMPLPTPFFAQAPEITQNKIPTDVRKFYEEIIATMFRKTRNIHLLAILLDERANKRIATIFAVATLGYITLFNINHRGYIEKIERLNHDDEHVLHDRLKKKTIELINSQCQPFSAPFYMPALQRRENIMSEDTKINLKNAIFRKLHIRYIPHLLAIAPDEDDSWTAAIFTIATVKSVTLCIINKHKDITTLGTFKRDDKLNGRVEEATNAFIESQSNPDRTQPNQETP